MVDRTKRLARQQIAKMREEMAEQKQSEGTQVGLGCAASRGCGQWGGGGVIFFYPSICLSAL